MAQTKKLDKAGVTFMSAGAAAPKVAFNRDAPKDAPKEQATYKDTGIKVWTAEGFLGFDGDNEIVKLNIVSNEEPKLSAGAMLVVNGELWYTPYLTDAKKLAHSFTVVGELVPANQAPRKE